MSIARSLNTVSHLETPSTPAGLLGKVIATPNDYAPAIARVVLGAVMFPHGAQKVLGWFGGYGFAATLDAFTNQMGIPVVFALLAFAAEFLGALGLITGLLSRVAAFGVGFTMLVAALTAHMGNGFFMNWYGNQKGEGFEYHLLAIGLALVVMIKGGGAFSVDRALSRSAQK